MDGLMVWFCGLSALGDDAQAVIGEGSKDQSFPFQHFVTIRLFGRSGADSRRSLRHFQKSTAE
jgi:hypothetical protein